MTMTIIFNYGLYRKAVQVYSIDGIHGWVDGMTFCGDKECECGWPKVEVIK
ncbi:MAG: hypothetical protein GY841_04270 [FCB group bacterium]|nr:hypothetical protein [FCB group bacterium]